MKLTFIKQHHWRRSLRAFSLVELSIVLVILGLLVGGALSGRSLIRAAEMRSIQTDFSKYLAAVHQFRDKYFALPGDMPNATAFWGAAHPTPATCRDTPSTTTATCNGNGNGEVKATGTSWESSRFWQHLANAALIEGTYDGVDDEFGKSRYMNGGWQVNYWGQYSGGTFDFTGFWGHDFELYDGDASYTTLTPAEAWNIDQKVDDGVPNTGKVWSLKGDAAMPCTTMYGQVSDAGAQYNLTYPSSACWIYFVNIF